VNKGEEVSFRVTGPFTVSSQDKGHPFYLGAHMTGQMSQGQDFGTGDPEWVNVIPPSQFLTKYVFFTDPTMSFTNLVFIRDKSSNGTTYADVMLDCMGVVDGWQSIQGTTFQYARVDLQANLQKVGSCDNGTHEAHSDAPFGLTVWGWDTTVSYAYPAGASVQPINSVVVTPTPN
jgi:hypothetical protein